MKPHVSFVILILALTSCTSSITELRKTNTATATEFVHPKQLVASINTPHASPTSLGQVTQAKSFDLYDERINTFKDTLKFTIRILDVSFFTKEDTTLYIIKAEGVITNISDKPIVISEYLRTGFTVDPEVYWSFSYHRKGLQYSECCVDGWVFIDQDDYILLQPNEFQRNIWEFSLPLKLSNSEGQEVYLSGKPIKIAATYINHRVGYALMDEDRTLVTSTDENGEEVFYEVDMNAWVGEVQSNSVTYVFP